MLKIILIITYKKAQLLNSWAFFILHFIDAFFYKSFVYKGFVYESFVYQTFKINDVHL